MDDIIIIGASFAGLSLAHHLPEDYKILIIERKASLRSNFESTGLITQATRDHLAGFVDVDKFIPNKITTIGVFSPDYDKHFFSSNDRPWIYSTDTPSLISEMAETVPDNARIEKAAVFSSFSIKNDSKYPVEVEYEKDGQRYKVAAKFLVGADGANSRVAAGDARLSQNKKFLAGLEKVFYGNICFGPNPQATVYHFWFGAFSLGYGGWLSPTIIDGRPAFRVGLAKLEKDIKDLKKLDAFIEILKNKGIVKAESEAISTFGSLIPIGGVLPEIFTEHVLLLGDAAGFCGAFAADGIKGAVLSGKVAAKLLPPHLNGNKTSLLKFKDEMQKFNKLMTYYKKQKFYRWLWNRMKRDRTFHSMYDLIAEHKDDFLAHFCDSKDNAKSLARIAITPKNFTKAAKYALYVLMDIIY
ncbi:MAG TPA: FAD-dependent monooxygenase [Candidatus Bipolaricaulota bacterium]|nr:FAD-dependent monooxygenase [Candidatus Bipolaricaulota bacterium]